MICLSIYLRPANNHIFQTKYNSDLRLSSPELNHNPHRTECSREQRYIRNRFNKLSTDSNLANAIAQQPVQLRNNHCCARRATERIYLLLDACIFYYKKTANWFQVSLEARKITFLFYLEPASLCSVLSKFKNI